MTSFQRQRVLYQGGFFVLFMFAPIFDLLRFDLIEGHLVVLGAPWTLGLDDYLAGRIDNQQMSLNILLRVIAPVLLLAVTFLGIAWRWGRLYCGWLCPHFSVVETINQLVRKASGKQSIWDKKPGPSYQPDGTPAMWDRRYWWLAISFALAFAFLWAVVLLTYLLPPIEVYGNLFRLTPTHNQALFIGVATTVLFLEFTFARHLFCRYACAVGMFQSLAWMTNRQAMVVGYQRERASDCVGCASFCDHACPMRLKPRTIKRLMFACTQCGQCIDACETVQRDHPNGSLLNWIAGQQALQADGSQGLLVGETVTCRS
ncbi:MAG TPA: 4Fe-4S binding protein [Candidatus Competibacteraceae bacterium]|nr:4Fe-4S binding protein [Candidatus Competibacteraceae bacterium]MCP5459866.1 4Fe-4S binding protein [Gammaproteobacteria bacterium]HPF58594.1 4Fe-4S binding protein [Candidatus Competibacteraceae bacterium]HRY18064.1 4Fe-4S binding protein [Candidatus Competibacteraceae bacterium]